MAAATYVTVLFHLYIFTEMSRSQPTHTTDGWWPAEASICYWRPYV